MQTSKIQVLPPLYTSTCLDNQSKKTDHALMRLSSQPSNKSTLENNICHLLESIHHLQRCTELHAGWLHRHGQVHKSRADFHMFLAGVLTQPFSEGSKEECICSRFDQEKTKQTLFYLLSEYKAACGNTLISCDDYHLNNLYSCLFWRSQENDAYPTQTHTGKALFKSLDGGGFMQLPLTHAGKIWVLTVQTL